MSQTIEPKTTDRKWLGLYDRPHGDLREFLERAESVGEVTHVKGANWDLELGALAEIVNHKKSEAPALLFDDIAGYPKGFRVLSGSGNSAKRMALMLGFPTPRTAIDVVQAFRDRMKQHKPIPPVIVKQGPILENIDRDDDVDLYKFPAPRVHERDGGRYIGTEDLVIMRDPEEGWVNAATYRVQVHSKNSTGLWMSPGKHGRQIRDKYFKQGKPCPVLVCCGHDPLLFLAAANEIKFGVSEFDYAGGHRGKPFEVIHSEIHGLPMPAHAEIILEGELTEGDVHTEGPFGEFTGYYASPSSEQPVIRVRRVYHRNDPILTMATPMRPPSDMSFGRSIVKSGMIWDAIERAGISGVQGVWCHEAGAMRLFNVISVKQAYAGHAKQIGLVAAGCQAGAYLGRFVVVVDEDVDPTDLFDVVWAISTRCDPALDIEIIKRMWSGPLDPIIPHGSPVNYSSRGLIDACRPFERLKDFPPVAGATAELKARVAAKFADILNRIV
jgi:4-hydroxy-3-polyprenylbenzoate decarboxylase